MIEFASYSKEFPGLNPDFFISSISKLIELENKELGEICVIACTNDDILEINISYLDHDYFTDVITFNYNEGSAISGDLFVSIDQVNIQSIDESVTFEEELTRVIFHGVLHLLGYNDKTQEEIAIMRSKEDYYLSTLFHVKQNEI